MGGCDREKVDVMDYVRRDEFLDSRRFGATPVEGQALRINVDEKSPTSVWRVEDADVGAGQADCASYTNGNVYSLPPR